MGEIKSTIELAMERTRGMLPSREEREAMARKEQETRVRALVRRLLDGELTPESLDAAVDELHAQQSDVPWRELVCRECSSALVPGANDRLLLPVLGRLRCDGLPELEARVRDTLQELEEARSSAEVRLLAALDEEGIRGSSVVANPESDPLWKEQSAQVRESFARWRDRQ